jgi:hypothetical protein
MRQYIHYIIFVDLLRIGDGYKQNIRETFFSNWKLYFTPFNTIVGKMELPAEFLQARRLSHWLPTKCQSVASHIGDVSLGTWWLRLPHILHNKKKQGFCGYDQ